MKLLLWIGFAWAIAQGASPPEFMGCYTDIVGSRFQPLDNVINEQGCIGNCRGRYFRYALMRMNLKCVCSNYLGEFKAEVACKDCTNCTSMNVADVYVTYVNDNGPPRNLHVDNVTDIQVHVAWEDPESFTTIDKYKVTAKSISTYAFDYPHDHVWYFSNNTYRAELNLLAPSTLYNITVQASSDGDNGIISSVQVETLIGEPDHVPAAPVIVQQLDKRMIIKLSPVVNYKGPVSSYLVVVINTDSVQAVQTDNLQPYRQATADGYSYYITAEIPPEKIKENFVVGDGKHYGRYYNAPLEKDSTYSVMVGVVSRLHDIEKRVFGATTDGRNDVTMLLAPNDDDEESSTLVIILSVAIVFSSCLLIAGLVGFYFLRNHFHNRHRQRLNDNQELTLQGPMIDIENSGYIHDDEGGSSSHYNNLHDKIWMIPRNFLTIDHTNLLGIGQFGRVHGGTLMQDNTINLVAVYSIADRKLKSEDKKSMLKNLDLLIKSKSHPNVVELFGSCEDADTICVVLEHTPTNLKEFLIGARALTSYSFSNVSENLAMNIATDVCKGMEYLHSKKILHRQLCAIHIAVIDGCSAKISGFGLAKYYKNEIALDYVRFAAKEFFYGQPHVDKSDVWSFACLLWEITALGGTPYGNVTSGELPEIIMKGLRLPQLPYVQDELYQIMLNCWQLDLDERPSFAELIESLQDIPQGSLNFDIYEGFEYEPYHPELEAIKSLNPGLPYSY